MFYWRCSSIRTVFWRTKETDTGFMNFLVWLFLIGDIMNISSVSCRFKKLYREIPCALHPVSPNGDIFKMMTTRLLTLIRTSGLIQMPPVYLCKRVLSCGCVWFVLYSSVTCRSVYPSPQTITAITKFHSSPHIITLTSFLHSTCLSLNPDNH